MSRFVVLGLGLLLMVMFAGCASQKAASHRDQGWHYLQKDNLSAALHEYDQSLGLEDNAEAHVQKGHILALQGSCIEALPELQAGLRVEKYKARTIDDLAACHATLGSWAEAAEYYIQSIELNPETPNATVASAIVWPNLSQDPRMLGWLERIRNAQPSLYYGWAYTGNYYLRNGLTAQARSAYEKALSLYPSAYPVLLRYGAVLVQLGDPKAAITQYKRAIEVEDKTEAHYGLAGTLFMMRDYKNALAELEGILAKDPSFAEAHGLAAQIYFAKGDSMKALEHGRLAVAGLPNNVALLKLVGRIAYLQRDYLFAANVYSQLTTINPNDAESFERLGTAWMSAKNFPAAQKSFSRAIMIDPRRASAHREMGILYYESRQFPQATAELTQATALAADDYSAFYHLGLASKMMGITAYPVAEQAFLKAAAIDELNPDPYAQLSTLAIGSGRSNDGLNYLDKAAQLGFSDAQFLENPIFQKVSANFMWRFLKIKEIIQVAAQSQQSAATAPALVPLQ